MNFAVVVIAFLAILIGTSTRGESVFVFKVSGITEGRTAAAAQEAVANLKGSGSTVVNIPEATVSVTVDEASLAPEEVKAALENAGFSVQCVKKFRLGKGGSKAPGPVP